MKQKSLLKKLFLLCALIAGNGSAWATDDLYSTCLFGATYNSKKVSSYENSWSATNNGLTWYIINANNNNNGWSYIKMGRNGHASVGTITTSAAYTVAISKVIVTIDALTANKINSIKLYTSSNNSTWTEAGSFTKATGAQTVALSSPTANLYYKVEFDCASGTSNGLIQVSKIEYYQPGDDRSAVNITSFSATETTLIKGETTTTSITNDQVGWTAAYTYSSNDETVATVDASGVITAVAKGTATITATLNVDEEDANYKVGATKSKSLDITVNNPSHTASFSVNGVINDGDNDVVEEGEAITFPSDPTAIGGKDFVGWLATTISGTTDTDPGIVTSANMGTADIVYYAVFSTPDVVEGNVTLTITPSTENIPTSYGTANTFTEYTFEGKKFKVQQMYKSGEKLQWRASGNENGTGTMYNTEALNSIQSIVLTYNGDAFKNFSVKVGDTENPTSGTSVSPTGDDDVRTYDCSSLNKDYFVLANGTNAGYLASIAITYIGEVTVYSGYCTTVSATIPLASACTDGANYYGTYSNSSAFVVPAGLTVSAVKTGASNTLTLDNYATGDVIPANTGVLVSSSTAGEHTVVLSAEAGTEKADNMLKPSSETMTGDYLFYRLTMHNSSQLGFWWGAEDGAAFDIAANKAYLAVPTAGAREGFTFGEDVTTAISEECRVKSEEFATAAMYDLQGRRISQPRKGLYISNGRKVFVK